MENYEVLERLGSGSFGEVLKCRNLHSGNFFAMKRFLPLEETQLIFEGELTLLSGLKHDNVVLLRTAFLHRGRMHAVFEQLEHSIFDEVKRKGCGLDSLTMKKYSFQILRAVEYLHGLNIMHLDIKPDNLLLSLSRVLKVSDFGSARSSTNHAAVPLSRDAGTMWFSAPEMLVMDPEYNKPVDVWAIGCTLVFMATGNYFLKGERFLEHIKMIITKVGPLTAIQEQQYFNNLKYARELGALPVVLPPTDLMEKYGLPHPLLAQLVEACLQMDPVDRWSCSALLRHPYFTQDLFHERFPKELEEMVDQDRLDPLMVEQESFLPMTWKEFQEQNASPVLEIVAEEKGCCLPTCVHLGELWKDITEALWRTIGKVSGLVEVYIEG